MCRIVDRFTAGSPGRRRRRRPAVLVAAVLLLVWGWVVLGSDLPLWQAVLAVAAAAGCVLRRRRDLAGGLAVAVGAAAAPTMACLIVMSRQAPGAADVVAVLTGYILVSPIPTLLAFSQRPPVISRPINALIGSVILHLGAVPTALFGDHGSGAPLLAGFLVASSATVWARQRRATAALLAGLSTDDGWTDLGRRTLPDGGSVHRLLLGRGSAIAVASSDATVCPATLVRALNRAVAVADTLGMPVSRVQPVVLTTAVQGGLERRLVNTGAAAASVIVTGASGLPGITRTAPRHWATSRRVLVTAAALPTRSEGRPW